MVSPRMHAFLCASLLLTGAASAQSSSTPPAVQSGSQNAITQEPFEMFSIGYGGALVTGAVVLDEHTVALGQGPGLVLDGCAYSSTTSIQWNDAGYYGMTTKNILSNDSTLTLTYDQPVSTVSFELLAFQGYSDSALIAVYTPNGNLIHSSTISVPGPVGVPFSYQSASIGKVTIQSQVWPWSTLIDNHEFGTPGPILSKNGACPGPMSISVTGATPNAPVAILYGQNGSYTRQNGLCAGTTVGISNPTLAIVLDTNGQGTAGLNFNAPPSLCGRTVQGVDLAACAITNKITL